MTLTDDLDPRTKEKVSPQGIYMWNMKLSLWLVWIALWIVNTYSEFQANIFSNNWDITNVKVFAQRNQQQFQSFSNTLGSLRKQLS